MVDGVWVIGVWLMVYCSLNNLEKIVKTTTSWKNVSQFGTTIAYVRKKQ